MGDDTPNEGFGDSNEHTNENEGIPLNKAPSNSYYETLIIARTLGVVLDKEKKSSSSIKLLGKTLTTWIEKLFESMSSP
ncbi:hypothetical protein Gogos_021763, partial [Gossypium gossypioides]|nr:hypothetical protein [Gossypium gossypioides]